MTIINQIAAGRVAIEQSLSSGMSAREIVDAATSLAIHQAMEVGVSAGSDGEPILGSLPVGEMGRANPEAALQVAKNYDKILVDFAAQDIRNRPTSDDVYDTGIKRGSKVVISIQDNVEKKNKNGGGSVTWKSLARQELRSLAASNGVPVNLFFDKFSVSSLQEPDEERYQIKSTFGADFLYTFGRRPRLMTLTGQVLNGKVDVRFGGQQFSMDWKNAMQRKYDKYYRATECQKRQKKIVIYAQDTVYEGFLLNMQTFVGSESQSAAQVTITFMVARLEYLAQADENIPGAIRSNGGIVPNRTVPSDLFERISRGEAVKDEEVVPPPKVESYIEQDVDTTQFDKSRNDLLIQYSDELIDLIGATEPSDQAAIRSAIQSPTLGVTPKGFQVPELITRVAAVVAVDARFADAERQYLTNLGVALVARGRQPFGYRIEEIEALISIDSIDPASSDENRLLLEARDEYYASQEAAENFTSDITDVWVLARRDLFPDEEDE